ncbi:MAG: DUF2760 domain-containing protein [Desulfobacteraceae bacterium]|nr:MAG: DUF2760 domain-containing protein [Desulfobacteraceae bacterium]
MKNESRFSLKALVYCLIIIGALVTTFYFMAVYAFEGISQYLAPLSAEAPKLSKEIADLVGGLDNFIRQTRPLLVPVVFGLGAVAALLLWGLIQLSGRRAIQQALPLPSHPGTSDERKRRETRAQAAPPASPSPAVLMLSILQRQGRFIDFLQEDLGMYSDEQVGAAVRNVHQGCKEALSQHVELKPIMEQEEGAPVTIQPGFDLQSIRLSGNVSGDPPFKGVLRHHGWRVVRVNLPKQVRDQEKDWVLAPAEVEI